MRVRTSLASAAMVLAACSFELGSVIVDGDGGGDGGETDASLGIDANEPTDGGGNTDAGTGDADATNEADAPSDARSDAPTDAPSGDAATFFDGGFIIASDQNAACPLPTNQLLALFEGPSTKADACDCAACSVTQAPSCAEGALGIRYDVGGGPGTCDNTSTPYLNVPGGSCGTDGYLGPLYGHRRYAPPGPDGGTCVAAGTKKNGNVLFAAQWRLCGPAPIGTPPGFQRCTLTAGDVACASGTKHLVGDGADFDCTDCACTTSTTCVGDLSLYSSSNCTGSPIVVKVDDVCRSSNGSFGSYKYVGTAGAVSCNAGAPPPAANVRLVGTKTLCCL